MKVVSEIKIDILMLNTYFFFFKKSYYLWDNYKKIYSRSDKPLMMKHNGAQRKFILQVLLWKHNRAFYTKEGSLLQFPDST